MTSATVAAKNNEKDDEITPRNEDGTHCSPKYDNALQALYSSLHQSKTKEELMRSSKRRVKTISDMHEYLRRVGVDISSNAGGAGTEQSALNNIIHVTGTKGKGSTCCFCESILRTKYGLTTGLFTSPHLINIEERIRINGLPVSKEIFGETYFILRERLEKWHEVDNSDKRVENGSNNSNGDSSADDYDDAPLPKLPGYFRMIALMAMYIFVNYEPTIDVIILEVGMGGRFDATNILDMAPNRNVVCGISLIDLDHTRILGSTKEQIAWEKGGILQIYKGSASNITKRPSLEEEDGEDNGIKETKNTDKEGKIFTLKNDGNNTTNKKENTFFVIGTNTPSVIDVLTNCAKHEGMEKSNLIVVNEGLNKIPSNIKYGLQGDHQRINAELAVSLCKSLVQNMKHNDNDQKQSNTHSSTNDLGDNGAAGYCTEDTKLIGAIENASWPGRCQTISMSFNRDSNRFCCTASSSLSPQRSISTGSTLVNLRCDGAHTIESIKACLSWFQSVCNEDCKGNGCDDKQNKDIIVKRFLVFNCSHERNPVPLLQHLSGTVGSGIVEESKQQQQQQPGEEEPRRHKKQRESRQQKKQQKILFDKVLFCRSDTERPSMVGKSNAMDLLHEAGINIIQHENYEVNTDNYAPSTTATTTSPSPSPSSEQELPTTTWQDTLASIWDYLVTTGSDADENNGNDNDKVISNVSASEAIQIIEKDALKYESKKSRVIFEVCVTGSLYVVGSILSAVDWNEKSAAGQLRRNDGAALSEK